MNLGRLFAAVESSTTPEEKRDIVRVVRLMEMNY